MPSLAETHAEPVAEPPRLRRRRSDGTAGQVPRDRLTTMIVLTALLHGLVILGITFASPGSRTSSVDNGIEVVLVSDELPEARENDSAAYLSQRTQAGSGNTTERTPAELPSPSQPRAGSAATRGRESDSFEEQLLATTDPRARTRIVALPLPATEALEGSEAKKAERPGDDELKLRGKQRDELYVTADTRASRLAPYLDAWRRRVERIGTLHYPSAAQRASLDGNPVVEVALSRDGRLQSATIQRSSGHPEIDAAALEILRLASPFDPFPTELAREYRVLRFAYEWQFVGGKLADSAVTVP
jgi:periplasmic protein TonB